MRVTRSLQARRSWGEATRVRARLDFSSNLRRSRTASLVVAASLGCSTVALAGPGDALTRVPATLEPPTSEVPTPTPSPSPETASEPEPGHDPFTAEPTPPQGGAPQPDAAGSRPTRRGVGLMFAGWAIFGSSYLASALIGGLAIDPCDYIDPDDSCRDEGLYLLVPVVGPLVAIPYASPTIRAPLAIAFVAQAAGLSLGIAGTVLFLRARAQNTAVNVDGVRLTRRGDLRLNAGPTFVGGAALEGGGVTLRYRF